MNPAQLQTVVEDFCRQEQLFSAQDSLVVGVSGGPDSVCLLAILHTLTHTANLRLYVAHLNHGLRGPAAQADAIYVAKLARQLGLPCSVGRADVAAVAAAQGLGLEAAARQERYRFLAAVARDVGATRIAVGHNANDQAETILLHLVRGSGVTGLQGMRSATPLTTIAPSLTLIRPLLSVTRPEIEAYCRQAGLHPRQDTSNQDPQFLRNYLRHQIIPQLETINPQLVQALCRTADLMAADALVLHGETDRAWSQICLEASQTRVTLALPPWQALPMALQRRTLRRAIRQLQGHLTGIEFTHIDQAVQLLRRGRIGGEYTFPGRLTVRVSYDRAHLCSQTAQPVAPDQPHLPQAATLSLTIPGCTRLPDSPWIIEAGLLDRAALSDERLTDPAHPWQAYLDFEQVGPRPVLRTRCPGDYFQPLGLAGRHQSLKTFMINEKIPAAERDQLPLLITTDGQIGWICGQRIDHRYRITAKTKKILRLHFVRQK